MGDTERVTALFGVRYPVVQAGMIWCSGWRLAAAVSVPVRLVDERLSTVAAQRRLHSAGRDTRSSRSAIDSAAATLIVQSAVDFEKSTGKRPGRMVVNP